MSNEKEKQEIEKKDKIEKNLLLAHWIWWYKLKIDNNKLVVFMDDGNLECDLFSDSWYSMLLLLNQAKQYKSCFDTGRLFEKMVDERPAEPLLWLFNKLCEIASPIMEKEGLEHNLAKEIESYYYRLKY